MGLVDWLKSVFTVGDRPQKERVESDGPLMTKKELADVARSFRELADTCEYRCQERRRDSRTADVTYEAINGLTGIHLRKLVAATGKEENLVTLSKGFGGPWRTPAVGDIGLILGLGPKAFSEPDSQGQSFLEGAAGSGYQFMVAPLGEVKGTEVFYGSRKKDAQGRASVLGFVTNLAI